MTLRSITLGANESNWRLFMVRKADPAFQTFEQKIFQRDDYTCGFCGFRAEEFQEVINLDQNYRNNKAGNLITACIFCTQCFFLEAIGRSDFGGGSLIFMPDMTQAELNALCHTLFASMALGNSYSDNAKNVYRSLKLQTQQVEKQLGEGFSNPAHLGQLLIDAQHENIKQLQNELVTQIRVLPSMTKFIKQINTWAKAGFAALNFRDE